MDEPKADPQAQLLQDLLSELIDFAAERTRRDKRADSSYSNNIRFESYVWDLKIIFGSLQQRNEQADIDWHTSVTIPWVQAKILDYYLRLNIAIQERNNGRIAVPSIAVPKLAPPSDEETQNDPKAVELFERFKKIHQEIFG
jgi:hypothetical protein